jgi:pyruvate/2-oxoglutarate/acetoin dehydrogenase E1 component
MAETTYVKAITAALATAMRADPRVVVLGEDVAEGGPYTATAGLAQEFGTGRVINTPISEAAITGVAIGAAQSGMRPVLEIMFIDFITLALDQLVNAAAKAHENAERRAEIHTAVASNFATCSESPSSFRRYVSLRSIRISLPRWWSDVSGPARVIDLKGGGH